ncbi:hypothetical protein AALO_G00267990 [Alosa alosa]|uniref:Uncharacterized protein n=1 Tax=Alosa alosa TaxID=278164 RepID=A0AAV6FLH8_9TELE|nr:hypothetical protein AALO_G00267990 [Alosa alosa]
MKNPVTVLTTMVSVEIMLYTMCLCAPQWLVQPEGTNTGLFAFCNTFQGFSSCTTYPAWTGTYSLSWMFLSCSCVLALAALIAIRPAMTRGKRAIFALVLNILSVGFCVSCIIAFMLFIQLQNPQLFKYLGWSFYICCATLLYASLVSVTLGLVEGSSLIDPTIDANYNGQPVLAT